MQKPDPIRLEVFHHLLAAVCEESGALLQRTAISPNIRERRDFSCALFDGDGQLVAQAAHIPVHLGSAGDSVKAVQANMSLDRGDVVLLNDPYAGGTHLPDLTMVRPVFLGKGKKPAFYLVNRAHHADIGGSVPGSMGIAADLIAEGLVLPPVKIRKAGKTNPDVLRILMANVRGPEERRVDLQAQDAALALAEQRLLAMVEEQGAKVVRDYCHHLMDYSERVVRQVLKSIPEGEYLAQDCMEDDGTGAGPFKMRLRLSIKRQSLDFDFSGTARQARGGINANRSIVMAACVYVLRCLCPPRLPTNQGLFRRIRLHTEHGSLLDPVAPAPVAGGNVETSQRLVDLVLQAMAKACGDRVPAASAGTMSNLSFGGVDPRSGEHHSYYETIPGGAGAGPWGDGSSALQTHMTNTRNTPVEEMELRYPLQVDALTLRRGSGGKGKHRGGDGLRKELTLLADTTVSLFAERSKVPPPGHAGGKPGKGFAASLRRGAGGKSWSALPIKGSVSLQPGDAVRVDTPGGGGWGKA